MAGPATFAEWLKQQTNREDTVGDLARFAENHPVDVRNNKIRGSLTSLGAPTEVVDAAGAALDEWRSTMSVVVHKWDVRPNRDTRWGPIVPQPVYDEIRLAHNLRNDLIEVERDYQAAVEAIWNTFPEVARLGVELERADELVGIALLWVAESRKAGRSKTAPKQIRDALAQVRKDRKAVKDAHKAAKSAAYEQAKPQFQQARNARAEAQKALYGVYVARGLYWATYNKVRDQFETAVRSIAAKRAAGQPADLRFHRWTGEGTIAVQIQRGAHHPARTPAVLSDPEGPWRNVFALFGYPENPDEMTKQDWARHARRGNTSVRFRVGSGDNATHVTLPVAVSRPIPEGAEITDMQLTVRNVGGAARASIAVTLRTPAPIPRTAGRKVSVHTGWRSMPDGSIRVAVTQGSGGPPEFADHPDLVRWHGTWGEIRVPAGWCDEDERMAKVAAQRDQAHNLAKEALISWLSEQPELPVRPDRDGNPVPIEPHRVRQWRSPSRLADLTLWWRDHQPDAVPVELLDRLEAWRKQDKHLWSWHANATDQIAARRQDAWRKVAGWLTNDAAVVVVDEWKVPDLIRKPDPGENDTYQSEHARRHARLASPGSLRSQLQRATKAAGGTFATPGLGTVTHHGCGGTLNTDAKARSHMVPCDKCGTQVDQDVNTLRWLHEAV